MTNCTEKTNTTNTQTAVYPNIRDIIADNDSNALDNACKFAVKVVTKTLLLQLKNDGSRSQYFKVYELYQGVRVHNITNNDVLDLLSVAKLAYYETYATDTMTPLDDIDEYYKQAFRAVRNEIYASGHAIPVEQLPVKAPKTVKPLSEKQLDNANNIITAITAVLTPRQIEILKLLLDGYNQVEIAKITNTTKANISIHLSAIRKKATALYPNGVRI